MLQTVRAAAWLGWQVESNWTDPLLFLGFSILKPIASVLILVFMYNAVSRAGTSAPIYAYIYLGNAFYLYVGAVMTGTSYAILDDRERFRTLKYLYIAPIPIPVYLLGRAGAKFLTGTIAVVITIAAGGLFFQVPIHLAQIDWPLFLSALALGIASLILMGISLGVGTLNVRSEPWFLGDALAAALYLFSGAIFPLSLLPAFLRPIGFVLPMTYWLELIRRALLGPGAAAFPTLAGFSNLQLFGILGLITLGYGLIAAFAYRYLDWKARERGMIDTQSNY